MAGRPDSETGYVEHPGGLSCGSCEYLSGARCTNPLVDKEVDPENGCCDYWDDGSKQPGIHEEDHEPFENDNDEGEEEQSAPEAPQAPLSGRLPMPPMPLPLQLPGRGRGPIRR